MNHFSAGQHACGCVHYQRGRGLSCRIGFRRCKTYRPVSGAVPLSLPSAPTVPWCLDVSFSLPPSRICENVSKDRSPRSPIGILVEVHTRQDVRRGERVGRYGSQSTKANSPLDIIILLRELFSIVVIDETGNWFSPDDVSYDPAPFTPVQYLVQVCITICSTHVSDFCFRYPLQAMW